ncbi:MAG: tetratricopeptide repeat protein [Pyrinomonadaceae bacterium]
MKRRSFSIILASLFLVSFAGAQVDDVSQVTGLPIPIGASVIYGQVLLRNVPRGERKPSIVVYLRNGGAQLDKYQTNDQGYWYFLRTPIDGHTLNFEIDGIEVGRTIIAGGISNRFRQDIELDWNQVKGFAKSSPAAGVVSARDRYERSHDSDASLQKALSDIRDKKSEEALKLLTVLVEKDPKDYNAWMYLGTIHYSAKRNDEARAAYNKAIALKPDYFLANLNLGRLEVSQKQFDPAIVPLLKAVEIDPASADANHLLGEAYLLNKKGSLAVGYLNKAIELAPVEKADLHLRLAALYNAAGLKDRAALEYKAFLEKVKDHPDRAKFEQYVKENLPKT